jgi:transposase, IS30 family
LSCQHKLCVSHERIYQYVYDDKRAGGTLHQHLRCQKQRRKRYGSHDRRGQLANRRSISERPAIVEQRSRLGDWEADTIVGKAHQQAIVSLTERKSKLTLLAKVEHATAEAVEATISRLLEPLTQRVHTITSDNGREFARHQHIATKLEADFYFAHPYASWERGLNENTNGLVRQYFPKGSDFTSITDEAIAEVMQRLNHRPRKTLGFTTPHQVFYEQSPVALTP